MKHQAASVRGEDWHEAESEAAATRGKPRASMQGDEHGQPAQSVLAVVAASLEVILAGLFDDCNPLTVRTRCVAFCNLVTVGPFLPAFKACVAQALNVLERGSVCVLFCIA